MSENIPPRTSSVDRIVEWMERAPTPAREVITLERRHAERLLDLLESGGANLEPTDELLTALRGTMAEPKEELWAIHSVGPGEVYPSLTRERAEQEAADLRACVLQATGIEPTVNVIPSPWEPVEHFAILAEEVTEHRDDLLKHIQELSGQLPAGETAEVRDAEHE
ncbi:hypothetical protein [Pseudomonas citronellolis]|uniref:hypothetical protein n=1 Tax=Pseudomonas citronellolis TaxID=53408 RepID=UPI00248F0067|nr:hypothetical protein [Pseudomonas citronellolis]